MTNNTPDRIWACMNGPMVGLFISGGGNAGWPEYVRADLHAALTARVAELEAQLADSSPLRGASSALQEMTARLAELEAANIEREAELIYLRLYGALGGKWELNESKDVWFDRARAALGVTP